MLALLTASLLNVLLTTSPGPGPASPVDLLAPGSQPAAGDSATATAPAADSPLVASPAANIQAALRESRDLRDANFPRPPGLESAVQFWIRVYSEFTTEQMALHDSENLDIVYNVVDLPPAEDLALAPFRRELLAENRARYEAALKCLASNPAESDLNGFERQVKQLWGARGTPAEFDAAVGRLRYQLGQADRFRAGVIRSGAYMPRMQEIAAELDVPMDLLALPHVESSFDPGALSHRHASGIWQWTRGTGRLYMRIDSMIDERRDPFLATRASLECLAEYRAELGSWALALTAYNHGIEGMRRASAQYGTDIVRVIQEYKGPSFRFASRNFYPEFLAALEVSENYPRYFGPLTLDAPIEIDTIKITRPTPLREAARLARVQPAELIRLNLAFLSPVIRGKRPIPTGYELRLPAGQGAVFAARNDPAQRQASTETLLLDGGRYQVRQGDTLSLIARRFNTQVDNLLALNGLESHRIYPGQVLIITSTDAAPQSP
jgi:membrane-bound lytic murein transglycosylase D